MLQDMAKYKWALDPRKYISEKDSKALLATALKEARRSKKRGGKIAIRDCFLIRLGLSTGLRVNEISQLICGDLSIDKHPFYVLVRHGKGDKERPVYISRKFQRECQKHLQWKQSIGEAVDDNAPLFSSSITQGHMSDRALQNIFKKCARMAGLPSHYSIHALRHTYACMLYKASGNNLRLVQKQLGHGSIKTTQIYADVMDSDVEKALEKLIW